MVKLSTLTFSIQITVIKVFNIFNSESFVIFFNVCILQQNEREMRLTLGLTRLDYNYVLYSQPYLCILRKTVHLPRFTKDLWIKSQARTGDGEGPFNRRHTHLLTNCFQIPHGLRSYLFNRTSPYAFHYISLLTA